MRTKTPPSFRNRLHELFQPYRGDPSQSRACLWIDIAVVVSVLTSCLVVILEHFTDPAASPTLHQSLRLTEVGFTLLFALEYGLRWYAAPKRLRHPFTLPALIDLLAILPSILMFVHIAGLGSQFLLLRTIRALRTLPLLRLLRLLKIFRHGFSVYQFLVILRIWASALVYQYRLGRLALLGLLAAVLWVGGANLVYLAETLSADPSRPSPYAGDYWKSYWGVIIFLISGLDVQEPTTLGGQILVTLLLLTGICLVAVFTGEVVSILVKTEERRGRMALKPPGLRLTDHIVLLGSCDHLETVIQEIHAAYGAKVYLLVVCEEAEALPSPGPGTHDRVFALAGDPAREDVLEAANLEKASRVLILSGRPAATPREADNKALMHALAVLARNRTLPLIVELQEPESLRYGTSIRTADCIVGRSFGEKLLGQAVLNPGITELYDELLTFRGDNNEFYRVPVPKHLVGQTFRQAQEYFLDHDADAVLPIGLESAKAIPFSDFHLCVAAPGSPPLAQQVLQADDWLIVFAYEQPGFETAPEDPWRNLELR